jgi:hypothetical protein
MAQGPYVHVSQATYLPTLSYPPAGTVQVMAVDTPNVSAQKEVLYIRTQLSPPYSSHPQAVELAALIRARGFTRRANPGDAIPLISSNRQYAVHSASVHRG